MTARTIAGLAALAPSSNIQANALKTRADVNYKENAVSVCLIGLRGWNRTNDQRINRDSSPEPAVPDRDESET
jgi:hypothetical protein